MSLDKQLQQFRFLAGVAMVDGELDASETPVLMKAAAELGVPADQAKAVLRELQDGAAAAMKVPKDPAERAKLFRSLVDLVAADGQIDEHELDFFKKIGPKFHLNDMEVEDLLHAASRAARDSKKKSGGGKGGQAPSDTGSHVHLSSPPKKPKK